MKSIFSPLMLLLSVLFFFVCVFGWITNVVKLFGILSDPVSGELIIRVVGLFLAPLGVVLGYL